jgi:hypothetical protein
MNQDEREDLASERAEGYAPRPTGGAFMAGVCVACVVLLGDVSVSAFYGWRVLDHLLLASLLTVAGFLIGFLGYRRLARLNRAARRAELKQIDIDRGGPSSSNHHPER